MFKPTAEQALRSIQSAARRRLNTALGVIWDGVMYRGLKNAVWEALDAELAACFGAFPDKLRMNRRYYSLGPGKCEAFLVVEYTDVAGGGFCFLGALAANKPDLKANYSRHLECPAEDSTCLVAAGEVIPKFPQIRVELSWQTPPRELVVVALQLPHARELLTGLGVTESERHQLLSLDMLEALGVPVERHHYFSVVDLVMPQIRSLIAGELSTLVRILKETAAECNCSTQ